MIQSPSWLYLPYIANILILAPVCWALLVTGSTDSVFEGRVGNSDGLRTLVGSLYLAILIASVGGIVWPAFFAPLILIQVIYKTCWLLVFILPLLLKGQPYPTGISAAFAMIVLMYPIFLALSLR